MGFLLRWVFAFALLSVTYNPLGVSFAGWAARAWPEDMALIVLAGLVLLSVYIVFLTAVMRGIGALSVVLVLAVAGAVIWVLWDYGWIDLQDPEANAWIGLVALSLVLAVGAYWG